MRLDRPNAGPYSARVLDIKRIREDTRYVRDRLAMRGDEGADSIEPLLNADRDRRALLTEVERLKAERNRVSREIGACVARDDMEMAGRRKGEARQIGTRITELEARLSKVVKVRDDLLLSLPNLPHESVPPGNDAGENVQVHAWGTRPEFAFKPKSHLELCEHLGLVDFGRGAKLAGSGFLLYRDWGAKLERALIQFLLHLHTSEHGYVEVSPPYVVGDACMLGVGQFPKFRDQVYALQEGEDAKTLGHLYLIPTAEAPVVNIHRGELLAASDLPIRYCAYSPCFRAEAGAAGVGTRGMIRVHQFDKVELVKVVPPPSGYDELEEMVQHAETVLKRLGLHYRVLLLCGGDMGFASAKTYDIEVWAPGQGSYLEVSSCSNCEDFQSRRMNLRFKSGAGMISFPHTLNGSGTALARLFVALVETYQQPDGSVLIPEPLRNYLGTDRIPTG